jgi:hypothetical protein
MSYIILILALRGAVLNVTPHHGINPPTATKAAMPMKRQPRDLTDQPTTPLERIEQLPQSTPHDAHVLYRR